MKEKDTIDDVIRAAKINLTESEKKQYTKDLKNILDAFSTLDEVDVEGIEPAFQPIKIKDRARKDIVEPSLSQKDALKNTKNKKDGYFVGPKAM
ncbi:MAG: Asp-tRNA(Asn)/Glu-tRNA(Gln) amidotransferase subunit GatC [archaeon]